VTGAELIRQAAADGVVLSLTPAGRLRLTGDQINVDRWIPIVGQYGSQIVAALRAESGPLPREQHAAGASTPSPSADAPGGLL
jgi:hypothetical protein